MNKRVAVVILNWNGEAMLRSYLPSVLRDSAGARIIVADNASTDQSIALLETDYPQVEIIRLDRNNGFAEGYNKALMQVDAEYYVLLNSDVEVTDGWLTTLTEFMDKHSEVAAVQPKMLKLYTDGQAHEPTFEYAGAAGGFIDKYGYPYCRGRLFNSIEKDHGQYDEPMEIHWASGACMLIRSDDYWQAEGLDGRFFAHNEEIDLCWRLRIRGRKIMCCPASKVYHLGGGTLPQGNPRKTYLNFRNNLTMLYKNLPKERLNRVLPVRCLLDYVAAMQSLAKGNIGDVKAIIKARRDYNGWRQYFTEERERIQSGRKISYKEDLTDISILWQYFAKHARKWSELKK